MIKLTTLHQKVEDYIENNRVHLRSYAIFNKDGFKNKKVMNAEMGHARVILANSAVKHLMKKDKIKEYLKEIPPGKDCEGTTLEFDVFVFSESQLKEFVLMIQDYKEPISNMIPFPGILN